MGGEQRREGRGGEEKRGEPCAAITHLPVGLGNGCGIGVRMWDMELGLWDRDYGVGLEGGVGVGIRSGIWD